MGNEDDKIEKEIKVCFNEQIIYNWRNITDDFRNACKDLNIGELVKVEYSNCFLFEAMTAIELMDPKMDVGMMCNRKSKILSFEQSIKAGKVKIADFSMEEKIGIIDETFACLATWLEGHSLAQTVFTNLYLHNPGLINDRSLKTFCFSILKIVSFIKQLVSNNASVIDEEVFQSMYGFHDNILMNGSVSTMLKDVDEELNKKCKSFSNKSTSSNDQSNYYLAFHSRIKFTRAFYQYFLLINKQSNDYVPQTNELNKKIEICKETFNEWKSTLDLGIKPNLDEFNKQPNLISIDYPTIMGFSPFVNQRSLPPAFPRYTKIKSRSESVRYLECLINRFKKIQDTNQCATFRELFLYCNKLSQDDGFHSCICSRSILNVMNNFQPMYQVYNGNYISIFKDDVWKFIKPFYLQNKAFFSIGRSKNYLEYFFKQCEKPFIKLLRTTCLNRARQREKLESVLYDLNGLVSNAEKLDAFFSLQAKKMEIEISYEEFSYFTCWTSYYLIRSMIQYLLFGFELELYSEHEFHFIYWYLSENLLSWMVTTLLRARNILLQFDHFDLSNNKQKKGKNSNKAKQLNKQNNKQDQSFQLREILKFNGLQFLTDALFKICLVLMNCNVIKQPKIIAENLQILYYRRLSSIIGINSPLTYANFNKFQELYNEEKEKVIENQQDYIKQACDKLEEAKNLMEYINNPDDEIESFLKVVKTNIVVLKLILSGHKEIKNLKFDFSVNRLYPIVKIV